LSRKFHYTLPQVAESLAAVIPDNSVVVGWSLGGMVAMQLAVDFPDQVDKLALVATSPQFFVSDDWPYAMDTTILENFANELSTSYRETILQFLAIQALGSDHAREEIRLLRDKVFQNGEPSERALEAGLRILRCANLRKLARDIPCPTLIVRGEKDRLVPAPAGKALARIVPKARLCTIKGASHAPFISHLQTFLEVLTPFITEPIVNDSASNE
jgi:pimeloyl-[acyl-carrier protein] methyl ester esterase